MKKTQMRLRRKRTGLYYINHVRNLHKFRGFSKTVLGCYLDLYKLMNEL
jgi:hypothetical protein